MYLFVDFVKNIPIFYNFGFNNSLQNNKITENSDMIEQIENYHWIQCEKYVIFKDHFILLSVNFFVLSSVIQNHKLFAVDFSKKIKKAESCSLSIGYRWLLSNIIVLFCKSTIVAAWENKFLTFLWCNFWFICL